MMSLSPPYSYMNTIYDDIRSIVPNVFGPVQCVCSGRQMSNDEIIKYACVASHCTIIFICLVSVRSLHFFIFFPSLPSSFLSLCSCRCALRCVCRWRCYFVAECCGYRYAWNSSSKIMLRIFSSSSSAMCVPTVVCVCDCAWCSRRINVLAHVQRTYVQYAHLGYLLLAYTILCYFATEYIRNGTHIHASHTMLDYDSFKLPTTKRYTSRDIWLKSLFWHSTLEMKKKGEE